MSKRITGRLTLVALPVCALALAACGSETIDSEDLQSQLGEQLAAETGPAIDAEDVSVECPEGVEVEEGRDFDCTLTAPNGDEVTVEVTLTDDEGAFEAFVPPEQFE